MGSPHEGEDGGKEPQVHDPQMSQSDERVVTHRTGVRVCGCEGVWCEMCGCGGGAITGCRLCGQSERRGRELLLLHVGNMCSLEMYACTAV